MILAIVTPFRKGIQLPYISYLENCLGLRCIWT